MKVSKSREFGITITSAREMRTPTIILFVFRVT